MIHFYKYYAGAILLTVSSAAFATEQSDSTAARDLNEVVVTENPQYLNGQAVTFIPDKKMRNVSATGTDLLERLGIPQIRIDKADGTITTNNRQPVSIFIDYQPATTEDLRGMRVEDVRKVEYYETIVDPRFRGEKHVIHFIMVKYEYGGYTKFYGSERFVANSGLLNITSRMTYRKMTYDVMGYGAYSNSSHNGYSMDETFRLPDAGEINTIERISDFGLAKRKSDRYNISLRAQYNSDRTSVSNRVSGGIINTPEIRQSGSLSYSPKLFPATSYLSDANSRSKYVSYSGNIFFILSDRDNLSVMPEFSYSHSLQNSLYSENGVSPISNGATDNTNDVSAMVRYGHRFSQRHRIYVQGFGEHRHFRTRYVGSAVGVDRSDLNDFNARVGYDGQFGRLSVVGVLGWQWSSLSTNGSDNKTSLPFAELEGAYQFNRSNSLSVSASYSLWQASPNYLSPLVIQESPLMSITGNPNLKAMKSIKATISYMWIPRQNLMLQFHGDLWTVGNRYVYDFTAKSDGILRTIIQPSGFNYIQGQYGVSGRLSLMRNRLYLMASLDHNLNHNGKPYDVDHSNLFYSLRCYYYAGSFSFGAYFNSPVEWPDGCMNGEWVRQRHTYGLNAAWGNSHWTVQLTLNNFANWNDYCMTRNSMTSQWYDMTRWTYSPNYNVNVGLAVSYNFGYGKTVDRRNELQYKEENASGILK